MLSYFLTTLLVKTINEELDLNCGVKPNLKLILKMAVEY